MFEINRSGKNKPIIRPKRFVSNSRKKKEIEKNHFFDHIQDSYKAKFKEEVNALFDELNHIGKIFVIDQNENNLVAYKEKVQEFLNFVIRNIYKIEEIYGKRIDYKIVRTINNELEELFESFLKEELPKLYLLSKLDEIRGLIIDLIL